MRYEFRRLIKRPLIRYILTGFLAVKYLIFFDEFLRVILRKKWVCII